MDTATILRREAGRAGASVETPRGYANALLDAAQTGQARGWEYALRVSERHAEGYTSRGTGYARGAAYAAQIINETA